MPVLIEQKFPAACCPFAGRETDMHEYSQALRTHKQCIVQRSSDPIPPTGGGAHPLVYQTAVSLEDQRVQDPLPSW
eukprot:scaffold1401_cov330-Pavlova_lutheri.AAC.132